jgi:hypothetical protein
LRGYLQIHRFKLADVFNHQIVMRFDPRVVGSSSSTGGSSVPTN